MKEYILLQGVKAIDDYPAHVTIQMRPETALAWIRSLVIQLEAKADCVEIITVGELIEKGANVDRKT